MFSDHATSCGIYTMAQTLHVQMVHVMCTMAQISHAHRARVVQYNLSQTAANCFMVHLSLPLLVCPPIASFGRGSTSCSARMVWIASPEIGVPYSHGHQSLQRPRRRPGRLAPSEYMRRWAGVLIGHAQLTKVIRRIPLMANG